MKSIFSFQSMILIFGTLSCGLGRDPKAHCGHDVFETFSLEKKNIEGSRTSLRIKGERALRVDGMDGYTEKECRDAGFEDQPSTLTAGLRTDYYICHFEAGAAPTWKHVEVKSDVDELAVSEGDWLVSGKGYYSSYKYVIPASIVHVDAVKNIVATSEIPKDWANVSACGEGLKTLTNTSYGIYPLTELLIH